MKIAIVGYGSIGQRHFKNFVSLENEVALVSRRKQDITPCYDSIEQCQKEFGPDVFFIATETSDHYRALKQLESSFHGQIIVEKPLLEKSYPLDKTLLENTYVTYNLRYSPCLKALKDIAQKEKVICVHCYVGQNLSLWRRGRKYQDSYSASKKLGGGVLRDLSHEIDYLQWIFCDLKICASAGGKFSDLKSDCEDNYHVLFTSKKCPLIHLNLNCLDFNPKRFLIAHTNANTYEIDLLANKVSCNKKEILSEEHDTYLSMARDISKRDTSNLCTANEALGVVKLIEEIESKNLLRWPI